MNKLFSKIATLSVGLAMAVGVGVALSLNEAKVANATTPDVDTRFALVTSTGDLEAGKNYVIASGKSGTVNVMSNETNANNRKTVSATLVEDQIVFTNSMLNLELESADSNWRFKTTNYSSDDGYLNATSSTSNNYLKVFASSDKYNVFSISFGNGNIAVITCTGKDTRNLMRANGALISCYTSGQDPVYLFKEVEGGAKLTGLTLTGTAKNTYYDGETFNPTGLTITANYSDDSHVDVTNEVVWTPNPLTTETTKATGTYKGKTVEYSVTVNPDAVASIAVVGEMTQTAYYVGTSWSSAGLKINATYNSGRVVENITENVEWSWNPAAPAIGVTSVVATATYETKSASSTAQTVTVSEFAGYVRVGSLNDFTIGDSYVIGAEGLNVLMGGVGAGKYRSPVDSEAAMVGDDHMGVDNGLLPSGVVIVTLLKAGENQYYLYDITNDSYLELSTQKNEIIEHDDLDDATPATFAFEEGELSLTYSTKIFGYNQANNGLRFSSYANYSANILHPVFFKLVGSSVKTAVNTFCTNSLKMDQYAGDETYDAERCVANYTAAKTAYQALSDAEVNVFINASEYADAKARFANWAAANGDNFNDTTGAFVRYNPTNFIGGDTSGYAIIIVIATTSILAFGLAIMLRKKHR